MITPTQKKVVEKYLCTRCGSCIGVCPQECILFYDYPVIGKGCIDCGLCKRVCPGKGMDLNLSASSLFEGSNYNEDIGRFIRAYIGHSKNDIIREKATSGGVVTSILLYLIEKDIVDGALVVTMDKEEPWKTKSLIATSRDEIIESAQTKYQITPLNQKIKDLDLERVAVVGVPCVIQGIRKIQENSILGEKIRLCIGLFCWVNMEKEATEFLLKKLKIDKRKVKSIEYRGGKWPGGFKVRLKDGKVKFMEKKYWNILPFLFTPERCLYCTDFSNELADISVGDVKFLHEDKGYTFMISRSKIGEETLDDCEKYGYISKKNCSIEKIISSESSALFFKKGAYKRMKKLGKKPNYKKEENKIPLKNLLFEFIFVEIHKRRKFFKKLFAAMPLPFFKLISLLITRERS